VVRGAKCRPTRQGHFGSKYSTSYWMGWRERMARYKVCGGPRVSTAAHINHRPANATTTVAPPVAPLTIFSPSAVALDSRSSLLTSPALRRLVDDIESTDLPINGCLAAIVQSVPGVKLSHDDVSRIANDRECVLLHSRSIAARPLPRLQSHL
jgi:hypothetical protein